jgi:hypothetical protein
MLRNQRTNSNTNQSKFILPNAFSLKERGRPKLKVKCSQNALQDVKNMQVEGLKSEFEKRSSSLSNFDNQFSMKQMTLSLNPSRHAINNGKNDDDDPFLPLLYIPANMYKKNVHQINKKSRSESRRNLTNKMIRKSDQMVSTLTKFSTKKIQKSLDEFDEKAKHLLSLNQEEKKL